MREVGHVGADVILKMARQWLPVYQLKVPEIDMDEAKTNGLPWCIIYDLDGTAAIMGDRSPYDASLCGEVDRPNHALKAVLQMVTWSFDDPDTPTVTLITMSGRDGQYREASERFLNKHHFPYDKLYMRATGDMRKDAVIKKEMYEAHIKGKYNVLVVFDDRNQMIDMWRNDLGLPCFQVNYGDF